MSDNKSGLVTGLGIAGLVTGILAFIFSFIPCFGIFAFYIGIIAILISVIGLVIAINKKASKGLLIAAILLSLIGCAVAYSQYKALSELHESIESEF